MFPVWVVSKYVGNQGTGIQWRISEVCVGVEVRQHRSLKDVQEVREFSEILDTITLQL